MKTVRKRKYVDVDINPKNYEESQALEQQEREQNPPKKKKMTVRDMLKRRRQLLDEAAKP